MTTEAYRKLADYWKSQGLRLSRGNAEKNIRDFELQHGVVLPPDLRDYLLHVGGMEQVAGQECDARGFAFWPLAQIKDVVTVYREDSKAPPGLPDEDQYYIFADYLQWSWAYAIRLGSGSSEPNPVVHVGTVLPKTIATSFAEFVDLYIKNASVLYPDPS